MSRFELVGEREELKRGSMFGHVANIDVFKDTKTGVLYAISRSGEGVAMMHLVDQDGKPLIDEADEFNFLNR